MRNPKLSKINKEEFKSEIEMRAIEDVTEDITAHLDALESMAGAGYSAKKGNKGYICTVTVECQQICSWF